MAFGQELKDFVSAFKTGYDMIESEDEKEARKARTRYQNTLSDTAEYNLQEAKDTQGLRREKMALDIDSTRTSMDHTRAQTTRLNDPELREAGLEDSRSMTRYRDATAREKELEVEEKEGFNRRVREMMERRTGRKPRSAVPDEGAAPGPTSFRDEDRQAIIETAERLGIEPTTLAAAMSYETGGTFNPDIKGGKGGNHQGLIQFGREERKAYGYRPGMSVAEQVRGPVFAYLKDRGVQPGHGIAEVYGIINGGSLKGGQPRWNASDGNGTIREHIAKIERQHLPKAERLLGYTSGGNQSAGQAAISRMDGSKESTISVAHDAVRSGLEFLVQNAGLDQPSAVADETVQHSQVGMLRGEGAADPADAAAAGEIIKEQFGDDLSEAEENLYKLAVIHDIYMEMGEPEKAQKAAASLLQMYRRSASQFSAIAKAAAEDGDVDRTLKAAVKAYNYIPDGFEMKGVKEKDGNYYIEMKDLASGKMVSKQLMTPKEIFGMAMQINPADFESYILSAAGARAEKDDASSPAFKQAIDLLSGPRLPSFREIAPLLPDMSKDEQLRVEKAYEQVGAEGGSRDAMTQPFEERIGRAPEMEGEEGTGVRGGILGQLERAQVDPVTQQGVPGSSVMEKLEAEGKTHLVAEFERLGDTIMRQGFQGDPRLLGEFIVRAATEIDPANPDAFPPGMEPEQGGIRYRNELIPIDQRTFEILNAMRQQAVKAAQQDAKKRELEDAMRRKAAANVQGEREETRGAWGDVADEFQRRNDPNRRRRGPTAIPVR